MSLIARLFDRRSIENPAVSLDDPAAWDLLGAEKTSTGVRVSRRTTLGYSPFWRGVNLISRDVAKLPLFVYKRIGDGKERDTVHPAYSLLRYKPNSEMTSFIFRQVLQSHALVEGNGYAYIDRDGAGNPMELIPLDPTATYPIRENGRLWYVTQVGQKLRKLDPSNVLHIKGLGYDGLVGYSIIHMARESIGLGVALRDFGSRFFRANARPGVVLEHPAKISNEAAKRIRDSWNDMHAGIDNAHKTAILEEGMKLAVMSINARDSQLLESRQFEIREIANWFGVPPHKLGDTTRTAFASLEQENQSYLDDALDPWLVVWEEECREKLLTEREKESDSHVVEFLRQALVRANLKDRGAFYNTALQGGWMNRDEIRARESMNPLPNGEGKKFYTPLNVTTSGENPPDDPPADPESEPEVPPPEARKRSAIDAAHRRVIRDAAARMVTRLATHARKAAKSPDRFDDWLDGMENEHLAVVRGAIEPVVTAYHAAIGAETCGSDEVTARLFDCIRSALDTVMSSTPPKNFHAAVDARMNELESTLPDALAELVIDPEIL